jgi:hypothetical protein
MGKPTAALPLNELLAAVELPPPQPDRELRAATQASNTPDENFMFVTPHSID